MKQRLIKFLPFTVLIPLVLLMGYMFSFLGGTSQDDTSIILNEHWTVLINDQIYEDVDLRTFKFTMPKKGDRIHLFTTLPETELQAPLLKFFSPHGTVEILVGSELLYRYGYVHYAKGQSLGYGDHYIPIPNDYMGKHLEISLMISESNSFSFIEAPELASQNTYYRDTIISHRWVLASNLFIYVFGFFLLFISVYFLFKDRSFYKLTCIALFSICISTWSICNYDLINFFTYELRIKVLNEFGSLYLAPLMLFTYFAQDALTRGNKFRKISYIVVESLLAIFVIVTFVHQFTNTKHFPGFLGYCHALVALAILYLVYMFIDDVRMKQFNRSVLMIGLLCMIVLSAMELIVYNLQRYTQYVASDEYTSSLYIGMLILVMALFGDFCSNVLRILYDNAAKATLEKLAYADFLTGLSNRRHCEDLFDELDNSGAPYILITFDLNDLKRINDSHGHAEGDRYIIAFSNVLKDTFQEYGLVARTGGDEFIAVLTKVDKADLLVLTEAFHQNMAVVNSENPSWNMSAAFGVYYSHEEYAATTRDAFRIADARMYDNKQEMKNKK